MSQTFTILPDRRQVYKAFTGDRPYTPGEIVDTAGWHNVPALVAQRYISSPIGTSGESGSGTDEQARAQIEAQAAQLSALEERVATIERVLRTSAVVQSPTRGASTGASSGRRS